ncbi:MAG: hypothetical protein J6V38_05895 [Kiritimatiellae bacterium]|nr:hypothetical protein [Kiritimatiellia bacterium]
MSIRNLLSCYRSYSVIRLIVYDEKYDGKHLKVCFDPGESFKCLYENDLEELDKIADMKIKDWYVFVDTLRILVYDEF